MYASNNSINSIVEKSSECVPTFKRLIGPNVSIPKAIFISQITQGGTDGTRVKYMDPKKIETC